MRYADDHEQQTFGKTSPKIAIVLNGPPGVGKDTLADMLVQESKFSHYKKIEFKESVYLETAKYYGEDLEEFTAVCKNRDLKDIPYKGSRTVPYKGGKTPREMLMHVSEDIVKPMHGNNYFGLRTAQLAAERGDHCIITDGGFIEEVAALNAYFDHVAIIQLYRSGCSFILDSRDYIVPDDLNYLFKLILQPDELQHSLYMLVSCITQVEGYADGTIKTR